MVEEEEPTGPRPVTPEALEQMLVLALEHDRHGRTEKAVLAWEVVLEMRQALGNKDTIEYAVSLNNLGQALFRSNEVAEKQEVFERAAKVFLECLRMRQRLGDKGTTDYANSLSWAALVLDKAGQHAQAVVLGEECLEMREKLGLRGTTDWIIALNNLGFSLNNAGQHERAVEVLTECLAVHKPGTKDYAIILNNLGLAYDKLRWYPKSADAFRQATEAYEKLNLLETSVGSVSLCNWGAALDRSGEHVEAARVLKECCALQRKIDMATLPTFAVNLSNLALALRNAGQLSEAIEAWESARHVRLAYSHPENADAALSLCHLATGYCSAKRYDLASQTFQECQEMRKLLGLERSTEYVDTLHSLGIALKKSGQTHRAIAVNEEWRQTKDRIQQPYFPDLGRAPTPTIPFASAPSLPPQPSPSPQQPPRPAPAVPEALEAPTGPPCVPPSSFSLSNTNVAVGLFSVFGLLFLVVYIIVWLRKPTKSKHNKKNN